MQRFLNKEKANQVFRPTIGCDFHNYKTQKEGKNITLQIWDTAGQERFQSLGKAFYRGSDAWILVYDVTSKESLINLNQWIETFSDNAGIDKQNFVFYIVGNKWDLIESKEVTAKEVDKLVEGNFNDADYSSRTFETSAETGTNIEEVFDKCSRELLDVAMGNKRRGSGKKQGVTLDKKSLVKRKAKSSCW